MAQSTIALIILLITVLLFITEKIPVCLTAMLSAIAMGALGIIGWKDVFSGMSNSIVIFLVGSGVIGAACFSTGLADRISTVLLRAGKKMSEKRLILLFFIIGVLTSAVFNGTMIVALLFPIVDALARNSAGRIRRKQLYMPTAVATVFGSNLTIIGSTSMMLAVSLLAESAFEYKLSFFEPFLIGLPGVLAAFLVYATFGCKMQERIFDYPDIPAKIDAIKAESVESGPLTLHQWITILTTVLCIVSVILGLDCGAAGFLAAAVLIITGCIDVHSAFKSVPWEVVFLVVGSLGIAAGLASSGAGQVIADTTLSIFSFASNSPAGICIVMLLMATFLSNFMSNGATVSIVVPIALSTAAALDTSAVPYVLAAAVGANISVATPICVTQITMSCAAGYNFRTLIRMGGFLNVLAFAVTAASLLLVYY